MLRDMVANDQMCVARVPLHFNEIGHLNGNISKESIYKAFHVRIFLFQIVYLIYNTTHPKPSVKIRLIIVSPLMMSFAS